MLNQLINSVKHTLNLSVGTKASVAGWVKTRRDSKAGLSFINLNDGSTIENLQVVANQDLSNYCDEILNLSTGAAIFVTGTIVESAGKGQAIEMQAEEIKVLGNVEDPNTYPIQAKRHTLEFLREVQHLRVRTNTIAAATRVRHVVSNAIHNFFNDEGFFWVHTPIITSSDCEGAGEMFRVSTENNFFGKDTFLTVSGQLNVEAYCMALSKVYTFGPTFRAENSNTSRHLAEFWMVEPEIAYADLDDIANLSEKMLKHIFRKTLELAAGDMIFFNSFVDKECISRLEHIINSDFIRISYTEAIEKLTQSSEKFEFPVKWGVDLQSEHERYLCEKLYKKPVIIYNYPKDIKSFYMRLNDDNKTVAALDVIVPGIGEIIGGSQREERYDMLLSRINELKLDSENYKWYLDLRKYGTMAHGGFGLGLERIINYITGLTNIRDVIPFPRTPGNAEY